MAEPLGTLAELRAALDGGARPARRARRARLARAAALEPTLHAFVRLRADAARARGGASPTRAARAASARSPLDGIPVALKDNLVQAGEPTTCASRILAGLRLALRRDRGRAAARGRRDRRRRAPTWTSSRWARRPRTRRSARRAIRGIPRARRAARRAARPRRSPRASCRSRSAATPAARSASPRRSAASSA